MVFAQILRRLIILSAASVMVSCATYRVLDVEILQPAKIQIEPGRRMALLDRGLRKENSPIVFSEPLGDVELIREFANGLNSVMTEMEYDTVLMLMGKERFFVKDNVYPFLLPADSVSAWCSKFNVDYIISLDMVYFEKKGYYLGAKMKVSLYKNDAQTALDSITLDRLLPYSEYEDTDLLLQDLHVIFWDQGEKYARRIIPYWAETTRRVYNHGKVLGLGDVLLKKGKTDEAIEIWEGALKLSDKMAIQASINLAWIYENAGNFDYALTLLQEAKTLAEQKGIHNQDIIYLEKYIQTIQQRIQQQEILNQQIN